MDRGCVRPEDDINTGGSGLALAALLHTVRRMFKTKIGGPGSASVKQEKALKDLQGFGGGGLWGVGGVGVGAFLRVLR